MASKSNVGKARGKAPRPDSEKYPNGHFFCHHCHKKIDTKKGIQCTVSKGSRCRTKYCKRCLSLYYGLDIEEIMRNGFPIDDEAGIIYASDEPYAWRCPRCADNCICWKCRRKKGLEPLGRVGIVTRLAGKSAAALLEEDPTRFDALPNLMEQDDLAIQWVHPVVEDSGEEESKEEESKEDESKEEEFLEEEFVEDEIVLKPLKPVTEVEQWAAQRTNKPQKRPRREVCGPAWIKLPTKLNRAQAEDRYFLREFVLRFHTLMDISAKNLEDLDEFDVFSDACAKTLILNLLDLIAADAPVEPQKQIKAAHKAISAAGFNLSLFWTALNGLRESVPQSVLCIADPAVHSIKAQNLRTRTVNTVTQAVQFIPVIISLIESAIQCASIRAEIENGTRDVAEIRRDYSTASRNENERWAAEKQLISAKGGRATYQSLYKKHKAIVCELNNVYTFKMQAYSPRFQPLGRDAQGRIYYISTTYKGKKEPTAEERASLKKWSWFLAVWCRISGTESEMDVDTESDEEGEERFKRDGRWWCLSDPKEIRKLARWINATELLNDKVTTSNSYHNGTFSSAGRMTSMSVGHDSVPSPSSYGDTRDQSPLTEIEDDDDDELADADSQFCASALDTPVTKSELTSLVKRLKEYADFLAWRCK